MRTQIETTPKASFIAECHVHHNCCLTTGNVDFMSHIYLTRPLGDEVTAEYREHLGRELRIHPDPDFPPSRQQLLEGVAGASALITTVTDTIDADVLDAAGENLAVVANVAVGFDNIDLEAAQQRGITVTNTPGVLDEAVADLTMAMLLSSTRRVVEADHFMRSGQPWIWSPQGYVGLDVSAGSTLGIIGLGRIGMAVARRAQAFGMTIYATGSRAVTQEAQELGVVAASIADVIESADVVSLHCPYTGDNHHLIGRKELQAMKPGSYLINTARGPLVDEQALLEALQAKEIAGAALDVFEYEPEVTAGLRQEDNVVLAPHIGSAGAATRAEMASLAFRNVAEVLAGREAITAVPPHT